MLNSFLVVPELSPLCHIQLVMFFVYFYLGYSYSVFDLSHTGTIRGYLPGINVFVESKGVDLVLSVLIREVKIGKSDKAYRLVSKGAFLVYCVLQELASKHIREYFVLYFACNPLVFFFLKNLDVRRLDFVGREP